MTTLETTPNLPPATAPISDRTTSNYLKAVKTAVKASISKRTTDWEEPAMVSLTEVVTDYFSRQDQARSTKALYRSAFLWYIRSGHTESNEDTNNALAILQNMELKEGPPVTTPRAKTIPQEDLNLLLDAIYAKAIKSKWAYRTGAWVRAGLACGARPIEWIYTEWVDAERTALRIRTAKVKLSAPAFLRNQAEDQQNEDTIKDPWQLDSLHYWESGGIDPYDQGRNRRIVPIDNDADRDAISAHLDLIEELIPRSLTNVEREVEFHAYYRQCVQILDRACRSIWQRRKVYSLYTMRGQFAANVKAAKGAAVAAELMGHSSADSPSTGHYGKGNQAHPQFKGTRKSPVTEQLNQSLAQHRAPTQGEASENAPIE